jgi:hypothetical protein
MALFVEVDSVEKDCKTIVNMDEVNEIAPFAAGGCALFFNSGHIYKVKNSYDQFKQFAMETVTADDIAKKVKSLKGTVAKLEIPTL